MELSDHTTITVLRAAWVIDVAAVLVLNWTALAFLRYLDAHPSAVGSAADDLPAPESRSWLWHTAGGGRLLRFAWTAAAVQAQDLTVRRYVWVLRVASATIAAMLITMLLVTVRHPSRRWNIVQNERRQSVHQPLTYDSAMPLHNGLDVETGPGHAGVDQIDDIGAFLYAETLGV
jgi:hypothetical protein